jgi:mannose-6-phosphate isomerase-like protein (cupin superfamily)
MTTPPQKPATCDANGAFGNLLAVADRLEFRPHRITHLLDAKGRHDLKLPDVFPFTVSLFHYREGAITQHLTWHERLELLMPLDGPMRERMGGLEVDLQPGDVLVVDNLKPHQVVDVPGLETRAVVMTFLPECVFTPGAPPADYAFLLPFFRKLEGQPQVLRAHSPRAGEAHHAIGRRDGFEAAIKEAGDAIEVVSRVPTDWNQEKALAGMQSSMQAHPDIGLVFASSDFMFPSIKSVLSGLGKWKKHNEAGHIILGGFDGDATAYQLMAEGYVDATGVQDVYWEAEQALQVIIDAKAGKPAPARIDDKGFAITQANLNQVEQRMWGAVVAKKKK